MTGTDDELHEDGRRFLPNHLVEEVGVVFLVIGIILIAASLLKPEQASFPHVFFAGALEMINVIAPWFVTLVLLLLVLFLLLLPFVDRSEERHPLKRKTVVLVVVAIIVMWMAFTIAGF